MKAINKTTGTIVQIIEYTGDSFIGKIVDDPKGNWKVGSLVRHFDKKQFYVILDWIQVDEMINAAKSIKTIVL